MRSHKEAYSQSIVFDRMALNVEVVESLFEFGVKSEDEILG